MSKAYQSVRGMNDLLPPDSAKWQYFERRAIEHFQRFGYGEVRVPVVEATELFSRGIGEATDIVEKEMYTFPDRKGRSLTMRPEGTAGCARAYIQHGIGKREPVTRWLYSGPMFRYERMQTGRYRQFYQIGVEAFGAKEPTVEAEQMAMLYDLYTDLGIEGLRVVINSVGGPEDRPRYREALLDYLNPHTESLCPDCRRRLSKNPLRVLDCKTEGCRRIVRDAPSVFDHLGEASRAHFDGACRALSDFGVPYEVDERLVRGLDYYTGTVFEVLSASAELGTQSTLVAGGRYDGLVESLGGPPTPAVGFALGTERNILCLPGEPSEFVQAPEVFVAVHGAQARHKGLALAQELRRAGLKVEIEHREVGMKAQLKRADKLGARFVVTLGETEIAAGTVNLRDMSSRSEAPVQATELREELRKRLRT